VALPVFTAGRIPTASEVAALVPIYAVKVTDETIISNATFQNDDVLFVSVSAGYTYELEAVIHHQSNTTPDIKFQWTVPSGATIVWAHMGTVTNFAATYYTTASVSVLDGNGGNASSLVKGIVTVGATSGTLQLQWAQITSNASNTIVRAGSYLKLVRAA
jgi:hypothetical protein